MYSLGCMLMNPQSNVPPRNVKKTDEQLHGILSSCRAEQGRAAVPHRLRIRALEHRVPLMMMSMQIAPYIDTPS